MLSWQEGVLSLGQWRVRCEYVTVRVTCWHLLLSLLKHSTQCLPGLLRNVLHSTTALPCLASAVGVCFLSPSCSVLVVICSGSVCLVVATFGTHVSLMAASISTGVQACTHVGTDLQTCADPLCFCAILHYGPCPEGLTIWTDDYYLLVQHPQTGLLC